MTAPEIRDRTLGPVMERKPLTVQPVRPQSTVACGFRQDWITGDGPGVKEFDVTVGAGLGSPYMILTVVLSDGTRISEYVDVRPMVTDWIAAVVEAGPTPKGGA